jgi:hypothetical protein
MLTACRKLLQRAENEAASLPCIPTGGEAWVYGYHTETEQTASQWKTLSSPRESQSKTKIMLIAVFDVVGLEH